MITSIEIAKLLNEQNRASKKSKSSFDDALSSLGVARQTRKNKKKVK